MTDSGLTRSPEWSYYIQEHADIIIESVELKEAVWLSHLPKLGSGMDRTIADLFVGANLSLLRIYIVRITSEFPGALRSIRSSLFVADVGKLASGTLLAQFVALTASPILTRLFTPEEFGVYGLIVAMMMILAVFATLRLELLIPTVTSPSDGLRLMQLMFLTSSAVGLFVLAIIAVFQSELEILLSLPSDGAGALYCLPVLLISLSVFSGFRGWCVRQGNFSQIGTAQVIRSGGMVAASILLGLVGLFKIPGLALGVGHAIGQIISPLVLLRSLSDHHRRVLLTISWPKVWAVVKSNSKTISAIFTSQLFAAAHGRIPILVIAACYGPVQAGFYALSERVVGAPTALVSRSIGDVFRNRAAKAFRSGKSFHGLLLNVVGLTFLLSIVPFTIVLLVLPSQMATIFGAGWEPAGFTIMMLSISAAVGFVTTAVDSTAVIVGARRYMVAWQALRFAFEGTAAACALIGLLTYESYISWIVLGRVFMYLLDFVAMNWFARGAPTLSRS